MDDCVKCKEHRKRIDFLEQEMAELSQQTGKLALGCWGRLEKAEEVQQLSKTFADDPRVLQTIKFEDLKPGEFCRKLKGKAVYLKHRDPGMLTRAVNVRGTVVDFSKNELVILELVDAFTTQARLLASGEKPW